MWMLLFRLALSTSVPLKLHHLSYKPPLDFKLFLPPTTSLNLPPPFPSINPPHWTWLYRVVTWRIMALYLQPPTPTSCHRLCNLSKYGSILHNNTYSDAGQVVTWEGHLCKMMKRWTNLARPSKWKANQDHQLSLTFSRNTPPLKVQYLALIIMGKLA